MEATLRNMKKLLRDVGELTAVPGVVAYSEQTGEEYSASPGDYWDLGDDDCLLDIEGGRMVLCRKVITFEPVRAVEGVA